MAASFRITRSLPGRPDPARWAVALLCSLLLSAAVTTPLARQALEVRAGQERPSPAGEASLPGTTDEVSIFVPAVLEAATPGRSAVGTTSTGLPTTTGAGRSAESVTSTAAATTSNASNASNASNTANTANTANTSNTANPVTTSAGSVETTAVPNGGGLSEFNPGPSCDDKAQELNPGDGMPCSPGR